MLPAEGEDFPGQTLHSPSPKEQKGAGGWQACFLRLLPTGSLQLPQAAQHNQDLAFVLGSSPFFEKKANGWAGLPFCPWQQWGRLRYGHGGVWLPAGWA